MSTGIPIDPNDLPRYPDSVKEPAARAQRRGLAECNIKMTELLSECAEKNGTLADTSEESRSTSVVAAVVCEWLPPSNEITCLPVRPDAPMAIPLRFHKGRKSFVLDLRAVFYKAGIQIPRGQALRLPGEMKPHPTNGKLWVVVLKVDMQNLEPIRTRKSSRKASSE